MIVIDPATDLLDDHGLGLVDHESDSRSPDWMPRLGGALVIALESCQNGQFRNIVFSQSHRRNF